MGIEPADGTRGRVLAVDGHRPDIDATAFVAAGATVVGRVRIGPHASIWYAAVVRADSGPVTIGARTNVQDGCVLHADPDHPASVGDDVTIGHRAIVHGCRVADDALVGMGAVLLNDVVVGRGALIAAGAVVAPGTEIPAGALVAGVPARVVRELTDDEVASMRTGAADYVRLAELHRSTLDAG